MKNSITYVAMDTHKKDHQVVVHFPEQEEVLQFSVKNTARDIAKMIKKILKQVPRRCAILLRGRSVRF